MPNLISDLREVLGDPVVFLKVPKGTKKCYRKSWPKLTVNDMTEPYLAEVCRGNVGVSLGEPSGGLCVIDWDVDELVEKFLALNPELRNTLATRGARGRSFWIRFVGKHPRSHKLKINPTPEGEVGEFRATGNLAVVWGKHPKGHNYRFVEGKPAVKMEYASIKWPPEIINPPATETETETETQEVDVIDEANVISGGGVVFSSSINSIEDALRVSLPTKTHANNNALWILARAIKALEIKTAKFTPEQLKEAFGQWYTKANPFLRPEQSREQYMLEFMNAVHRAKIPIGGAALEEAWRLAGEQPLPPEASDYEDPQFRQLIAVCRQLQIKNGTKDFFLSSHECAKRFKHPSHHRSLEWLGALCSLDILKQTGKGNARQAARYRYLKPINETQQPK